MTAVVHLHIHLDHITDNTAQAIRLILDGIEASLADDEIDDTPEPPPPPGPTVTIPEIILPDEHDAHQAAQQLVCSTCGTTRYTDLRGLRSHERSHETILCDCGRTISRTGIGPHRKHCPGPPTPPATERRPFDPEEARRRAARAAIGEE